MTGGSATRVTLTNLQTSLKNLQIKARSKVPGSWNQLLLEMNDIFAENAFSLVLFVRF